MKKTLLLGLLSLFSFCIVSCGGTDSTSKNSDSNQQTGDIKETNVKQESQDVKDAKENVAKYYDARVNSNVDGITELICTFTGETYGAGDVKDMEETYKFKFAENPIQSYTIGESELTADDGCFYVDIVSNGEKAQEICRVRKCKDGIWRVADTEVITD